jgi:hypothetical protein
MTQTVDIDDLYINYELAKVSLQHLLKMDK